MDRSMDKNFHITYEEDSDGNCIPIITLEVMSDSSNSESCAPTADSGNETQPNEYDQQTTGHHFLTEKTMEEQKNDFNETRENEEDHANDSSGLKNENVEYKTRSDGSVVCRLCGEILQSRTHWYRHKYKFHAPQSLNPAPLFQCEQCLVFFKSRKGYIGHIASRHSEILSDTSPVLTNAQIEAMTKEHQQIQQQQSQHQHLQLQQHYQQPQQDFKDDLDPELAIPTTSVLNYQAPQPNPTPVTRSHQPPEQKKLHRNTRVAAAAENSQSGPEYDEKRIREEKLVSDIIDRVRRECEAQGAGGPARRGYSRRTTVMHT